MEKENHYQCAIRTNRYNSTTALRGHFKNWFQEDLGEDELKMTITPNSLVIKKHDNWEYLVGYCCKEGIPITNMNEENIKQCIAKFEDKKIKPFAKRKYWTFEEITEYICAEHMKHKEENKEIDQWQLTSNISIKRAAAQIAEHISALTWQRINQLSLEEWIKLRLTQLIDPSPRGVNLPVRTNVRLYTEEDAKFIDELLDNDHTLT